MINRDKETSLYDATGFKSSARFWRGLLRTDSGSPQSFEPEDVQHERRLILYRLLLPIMLCATTMVLFEGLSVSPSPIIFDVFAGLASLLLAVTAYRMFRHNNFRYGTHTNRITTGLNNDKNISIRREVI